MHYITDVTALLDASSEPVQQRFALDCAERALRAAIRTGRLPEDYAEILRAKLALKRTHLTEGAPDRAEMMALLEAHFVERDARPQTDGLGFDGAVCWALDVESPVVEAAREAASEASMGVGWEVPRAGAHRNQAFFFSDNEDQWQLRRLRWLSAAPEGALFHLEEGWAAPETRLDFNPEEALEAVLAEQRVLPAARRAPLVAEVLAMLDEGCWAVALADPPVLTIAHSRRPREVGAVVALRALDGDLPAPFEVV